jgi:hypothetical protein
MHVNSSSMIWVCNVGECGVGWVFSIKKSTVDGCGYWEVGRGFIYMFSSEMFSHISMGTDSRDFDNGYPLCIYMYISTFIY